jgi:SPP1 family predicted phage head-tail adaptor
MRAGPLDRYVSLQHRVLARNATTGEEAVSYTEYASVWASKKDIRGREFFAADQMNSEVSTTFQIRYRTDVVMTDRIVMDGLNYNVVAIGEMGRRDGLEIQANAVRD